MSHVETQLLAYLDGELSPADIRAVEAHIAKCQSCAAELAELRALRSGLTDVIPAAFEAVQLPREAEERIRSALAAERARQERTGSLGQAWGNLLAGLAAALGGLSKAAAPLVAVFFVILTANASRLPQQAGLQQTVLLGRDTFAPGTEAAVRVLVRDGETTEPIPNADVTVRMRQAGLARTVYTGSTDATGTTPVRFQVPEDWQGDAELEVEASSKLGNNRIVEPIRLERSYRLLLSSDKPVYQPGEIIHLRTLALGSVDGRPAAGETSRFQVLAPDGTALLDQAVTASDFGIAATDLALDETAGQGRYQLRAAQGDTVSEMSVQVSQAELPSFRVDVEADATYYLPGDLVSGQVNAGHFFGKPLAGADVELRLLGSRGQPGGDVEADRLFVRELRGRTDEAGSFAFQFELPELSDSAFGIQGTLPLDLEAAVTDAAGQREFAWQGLTMARQPILIDVVAEGGALRAGVENLLYVLTSYPDGQPAPTSVAVQIGEAAIIEDVTSDFGLADVRYTPRAGDSGVRDIRVTAVDAAGRAGETSTTLPLDEARETLLLRTDQAIYRVGDTLALEALATGAGEAVYLDVVKGGQTLLSLSVPVVDGKATLGIDLTPDLAGTLELYAYQVAADGTALSDNRVIVVDQPEGLQVQLATDRPDYRAGEEAVVTAAVTAGGQPVEAAVGLAAVNEAVYAQREYQPGYARLYFTLDEALQKSGVNLPASDAQVQELRTAQQQAAKATWAGYAGQDFTLVAQSTDAESREAVNRARERAFRGLNLGLSIALVLAPLLLAIVVIVGLRRSGLLGKAAGRAFATVIILALAGAALLAGLQAGLAALSGRASLWILAGTGLIWLAALIWVGLYGWRNRDGRAQYVAAIVLAYVIFLAAMSFVAGEIGQPAGFWLALLAAGFGILLAGLLIFGWGLRLEGERLAGWAVILLAVLALPLVVTLNAVAGSGGSDLIQRIAGPTVYGLQSGLLTGCASPAPAPMAAEPAPAAEAPAEEALQEMPAAAPLALDQEVAPQAQIVPESAVAVEKEAVAEEEPLQAAEAVEEVLPLEQAAPAAEMPSALPAPVTEAPAEPGAGEAAPMLAQEAPAEEETPLPAEEGAPAAADREAVEQSAAALVQAESTPTRPASEEAPSPAPLAEEAVESAPALEPAAAVTLTLPAAKVTATQTLTAGLVAEEPGAAGEDAEEQPDVALRSMQPQATPEAAVEEIPEAAPAPVTESVAPAAEAAPAEPAARAAQATAAQATPTPTPLPAPTPLPTATPFPTPAPTPEPALTATPAPAQLAPPAADGLGGGGAPPEPTPIPPESLPIIRQRFPQTLYWNPEIVTGEDGQLQVRIPTGDSITTWRLTALAVSRDGALGSASLPLVVFQPLFIQPQVPDPLYAGDVIYAPVQIFNYSSQPLLVGLSVQTSPGLAGRVSEQPFRVPANESLVVPLELRVLQAGEETITLTARDENGIQDAQQISVTVLPEPAG